MATSDMALEGEEFVSGTRITLLDAIEQVRAERMRITASLDAQEHRLGAALAYLEGNPAEGERLVGLAEELEAKADD